ncbi:MAG: response regulator [Caulobacter sp.]|nr:response regulator [Caulobacter sp.]MDP1965635.1 response regulator [Reyranella sp.]
MSELSARRPLVAIIEDDAAVLHSLQFALEAQGYEVCLFERAQDAIDSREIQDAGCLLIDYGLPDLDGLSMLEALRRRGLDCPAIIIAGHLNARCRKEAGRAGAVLVEKPIMGDLLNELLRDAMAGKGRLRRTDA